jgi:hypothetical protein
MDKRQRHHAVCMAFGRCKIGYAMQFAGIAGIIFVAVDCNELKRWCL